LLISKLKKETRSDFQQFVSTSSPEAYRYFIYGNTDFFNRDYSTAIDWFLQAVEVDSNFVIAIARLAYSYGNQGLYKEAKKWCLIAYGRKNIMSAQQRLYIDLLYATYFETPVEELKFEKRLLELDDQLPIIYYRSGLSYNGLYQYDKAIPEFEKALEIYNKWGLKDPWVYGYTYLGWAYHKTGQFKKEKKLYKKAEQDFPDDPSLINNQVVLALTEGDTSAANEYIEKGISVLRNYSVSEADITSGLGSIYSNAGIPDKAEEYYRKALSLEPENPNRLNDVAFFLINNGRNINEGLELIEKALESDSIDYNYLVQKAGDYTSWVNIRKHWNYLKRPGNSNLSMIMIYFFI
jgi:tetratricopeptide (TPR) repeat protein